MYVTKITQLIASARITWKVIASMSPKSSFGWGLVLAPRGTRSRPSTEGREKERKVIA